MFSVKNYWAEILVNSLSSLTFFLLKTLEGCIINVEKTFIKKSLEEHSNNEEKDSRKVSPDKPAETK